MTDVIIVEDEELAAQKLARQLRAINQDINIVTTLDSVAGTVKFLSEKTVDLIFLDIHLGDDLSFKIFDQIVVKTPIIFTTAYDQYAIKAFKVNSVDYLLKPVGKKELNDALDKYFSNNQPGLPIDYQQLIQTFQAEKEPVYQERFMVYKGDRVKTINVKDIAYFFAEGKYVYLVENGGQKYLVDYSLDKLYSKLDPGLFFRINRQFIIHINAIGEMIAYSKGRLKILLVPEPKRDTIVSTDRASAFKSWLNR